MNKIIFLIIILLLTSCSNIEKRENLTDVKKREITGKIYKVQDEILNLVNFNEKEKIKEKVADTLKNRIMFNIIQEYDLNKILILFSKEIDILDENTARNILLINFDANSNYFYINWKKIENDWKIYSVDAIE